MSCPNKARESPACSRRGLRKTACSPKPVSDPAYNQDTAMGVRGQFVWNGFNWRRSCRALLVLLVLVNFAALQASSVVETHAHHDGGPNHHCCPGCHGGHFPVLQTACCFHVAAISISGWRKAFHLAPATCGDGRTFNS